MKNPALSSAFTTARAVRTGSAGLKSPPQPLRESAGPPAAFRKELARRLSAVLRDGSAARHAPLRAPHQGCARRSQFQETSGRPLQNSRRFAAQSRRSSGRNLGLPTLPPVSCPSTSSNLTILGKPFRVQIVRRRVLLRGTESGAGCRKLF